MKFMLAVLLALLTASGAMAQDLSKYEAIFISKFIDYIEWPGGKADLRIGIVGNSRLLIELNSLYQRKDKNYTIEKIAGFDKLASYDLIFVPQNETKNFGNVLRVTNTKKGVLVITEDKALAPKGAGISFYAKDNKLRFIINQSAIEESNLRISKKLLNMAEVI